MTQQLEKREDESDSCGSASPAKATSHDGGQVEEATETASLELILREIRDFRQDCKSQLEDIKDDRKIRFIPGFNPMCHCHVHDMRY
ncbi:hypothetical protein NFI96_009757 [Prochilodus magdalenae]|nr:hypothetical protein NFI96_009757 [Prochilodus magdalenae]